jgi:iron only hydrogenase large subunit-like protein
LAVEVEQMLMQQEKNLQDFEIGEIGKPFQFSEQQTNVLLGHHGSGSGGYADFIFHYAAKHLFQESDAKLEYKSLRNPDFQEAVLEKNGEVVLRFAIANGFRNIQNLVQKLKRGKSPYDYVEVMACPMGKYNYFTVFKLS